MNLGLAGGARHSDERLLAADLRDLAAAVRRIGDGLRSNPEQIAIAKDDIAQRLFALARRAETGK